MTAYEEMIERATKALGEEERTGRMAGAGGLRVAARAALKAACEGLPTVEVARDCVDWRQCEACLLNRDGACIIDGETASQSRMHPGADCPGPGTYALLPLEDK